MTDFKGSVGDAARIKLLNQQRERQQADFERTKQQIKHDLKAGVGSIDSKFASISDDISDRLKQQTVGLVSFADFKRKRENLEQLQREELARQAELAEKTKKQRSASRVTRSKLSFLGDDEEEELAPRPVKRARPPATATATATETTTTTTSTPTSTTTTTTSASTTTTISATPSVASDTAPKKEEEEEETTTTQTTAVVTKKIIKNPFVDTSFLPDREREEEERRMREKLTQEWEQEQERIKNELIDVTYSYWDGTGHRRTTTVKKGTRIDQFLDVVRQEFHELRGLSPEHLLFIKEDVIIPQHYSFYDLIVSRARGKSGPLWSWDVHEDVRTISDATKEKEESHAGKVVERRWYERNKHIFPASRWEVYDPDSRRDRYTIHGE